MTAPAHPGKPAAEQKFQLWAVILLSGAGALAFVLMAFFSERGWGGEERTLHSIPFTYVHDGKLALPVYGYSSRTSYDRLFVHPPVHYWEIGLLMRLGLPLYYAEASPTLFAALLCLFLIVTARFSRSIQLGLIAGFMTGVGWIVSIGRFDYAFHLRPDMHMAVALLGGLLALEAARAQGWEAKRVFAGSLLLTYGSTLHYPVWPGWLGLAVYAVLAWRELPRNELRARVLAGIAGGLVAGVPYLCLHLIPNWRFLQQYSSHISFEKLPETIARNFPIYDGMFQTTSAWPFRKMLYNWPLTTTLGLSLPPFVVAGLLLWWHKELRPIVLATLPLSVFLFALLDRKLFCYFYLECILLLAGAWVWIACAWCKAFGHPSVPPFIARAAAPVFSVVFLIGYWLPPYQVIRQGYYE